MQRMLIIGLDGATWDIIMPLIKNGQMPALKTMVENGAHGTLESIIPPVTGGAWLAIATGKNPGKTGIIDFLNRKNRINRLSPTTSSDFKGHAIWDYLSIVGKKIGIFNYPMLFPPYKINGFMISGMGASPHDEITYPASLKKEIEKISGKYEIYVNYHDKKYEDIDLFIKDINLFLDKFEKIVYYLIQNKEWDFLFLVFSVTDWVQHIMWRHVDVNHPLYDPKKSPIYRRKFVQFWRRIDNIIGNILQMIGNDTIIFIISDHGFGPNDQTFNLAKWLKMKRYLVTRMYVKDLLKRLLSRLAVILAKTPIKKFFSYMVRKRIEDVLVAHIADRIDFRRSKAYCLGHTIPFGAIYINATNEEEKKKIMLQLIEDLSNISRDIRKNVNVEIYEPKKMYAGEKVYLLPDIIFTINNWRCVIIEDDFSRPLFEEAPFSNRHTGSHRLDGIFIAYGPNIKRGYNVGKISIYDIAPTILHVFSLPIPDSIDGKVILDIFESHSRLASKKPIYVNSSYYEKLNKKMKIYVKIKQLKMQKFSNFSSNRSNTSN